MHIQQEKTSTVGCRQGCILVVLQLGANKKTGGDLESAAGLYTKRANAQLIKEF
jgi:hypothetical protein